MCGAAPDSATGARSTPIYQTIAYVYDDTEHSVPLLNLQTCGNISSCLFDPTVSILEEQISDLEGVRGATCTASGRSAQLMVIFKPISSHLQTTPTWGQERGLDAPVLRQHHAVGETINNFACLTIFVDVDDFEVVCATCGNCKAKMLCVEKFANPGNIMSDRGAP